MPRESRYKFAIFATTSASERLKQSGARPSKNWTKKPRRVSVPADSISYDITFWDEPRPFLHPTPKKTPQPQLIPNPPIINPGA